MKCQGQTGIRILHLGIVKGINLEKHIRVHPEQWRRLEEAAAGSSLTPTQMVAELAMKTLDRNEWPRTEAEIQLLRSAMFTAQATI